MGPSRSTFTRAALAAALLLASLPLHVAADAELQSTVPADGATLTEPPDVVSATFDEALGPDSTIELRDAAGATLASGGPDAAVPARLALEPPTLGDGRYEVRWTAVAADGHVTRGTFTFAVAVPPTIAPTPSPTPSTTPPPSASPLATASPTAAASPTPAPSAAPAEPVAGTADVLIPILVAVVVLGAFGAWLLRRRNRGT